MKVKNVIAFPGVPQFCRRAFVDLEVRGEEREGKEEGIKMKEEEGEICT